LPPFFVDSGGGVPSSSSSLSEKSSTFKSDTIRFELLVGLTAEELELLDGETDENNDVFELVVGLTAEELELLDGETDENNDVFDPVDPTDAAGDTNVEVDALGDANDVLGDARGSLLPFIGGEAAENASLATTGAAIFS